MFTIIVMTVFLLSILFQKQHHILQFACLVINPNHGSSGLSHSDGSDVMLSSIGWCLMLVVG